MNESSKKKKLNIARRNANFAFLFFFLYLRIERKQQFKIVRLCVYNNPGFLSQSNHFSLLIHLSGSVAIKYYANCVILCIYTKYIFPETELLYHLKKKKKHTYTFCLSLFSVLASFIFFFFSFFFFSFKLLSQIKVTNEHVPSLVMKPSKNIKITKPRQTFFLFFAYAQLLYFVKKNRNE